MFNIIDNHFKIFLKTIIVFDNIIITPILYFY